MWSLFPKSWFASSDPNVRRLAAAVDHLKTDWLKWLSVAMSKVERTETLSRELALTMLPSLDSSKLLKLDQAFRHGEWIYPETTLARGNLELTPVTEMSAEVAAYLFTGSCNPNGMIRERALIAFGNFPDRLAIAAALIRCDDWVPQVQRAAVALLVRLVDSNSAHLIFEYLPLLLQLRQRQRIAGQIWPDHIDPVLQSPKYRGMRWSKTTSKDKETRAYAYQLAFRADSDRTEEVLQNASADLHPQIANWALGEAATKMNRSQAVTLFRNALHHKHSAVRAHALRQFASYESIDLRSELQRALFDSSRGPRDSAAHLLNVYFQDSALRYWRDALDSEQEKGHVVAINALSFVATAEDIVRLERYLQDPVPRVRAFVLRGLLRAKAPDVEDYLSRALRDSSALVVRFALRLIASEKQLLDREELEDAYNCATSENVRRQLMHSARLLGKWESLAFLLRLMSKNQTEAVGSEVDRWLLSSNRRFTPLLEATRSDIVNTLVTAKNRNPKYPWIRLEQLLAHA